MRYFLHLSYQGKHYCGWQRQTNAISIQQIIEDSISKMLGQKNYIHGCGRTDSGVHAFQYFAHIDISKVIDYNFVERINRILPPDISIFELIPVHSDAHAQYDVQFRTYEYFFHTAKIASKSELSAYYNVDALDMDRIEAAIEIIRRTKDFRSLCKNPDLYKHTLCEIYNIKLSQSANTSGYKITIKADRFLRGMIRYIVARLIDVGTHKLSVEEFDSTLSSQSDFHWKYQKKGYPQGLFLSKVEYPYLQRQVIR
ncbi:MAG: tRNA pseudouridine(38-40) synthase TruA [Saprospiraceae bacterium]|nr:tRNA pseudouridine(38-40) synthase TruA [Saprospiraceae bacterium]